MSAEAELLGDRGWVRREVESPERPAAPTAQAEGDLGPFFAQSLDPLCVGGLDGFFKLVNPAWTALLGWAPEELRARAFIEFVHPDDRQATLAELARLAGGAEISRFDSRFRHRDGSHRWLRWHAWPAKDRRRAYAAARDVTRQKRLEREILEIMDREKERLGQELHDGLGQTLAGIAALSSSLSARLTQSAESAAAAEITALLNEAIGEARDLAHGFGPIGLNGAGLGPALEDLATNVQHRFRIPCELTRGHSFQRLREDVEAHLYRVAQEAVNNSVVHGRPERVEISLSSNGGEGVLSVRDDGLGLPEEAGDSDGIGLHTMAYRARLIGGSLEVRRRRRGGTTVACTFPLVETPDLHEDPEHARETP